MTAGSAVGPTLAQRWRGARWVVLTLAVVIGVAALTTYLTAPRPGGRMELTSTSSDGARALATLLRERGVEIIEAPDIAAVERAARPDTLILVAQTRYAVGDDALERLARLPGDRLLVDPTARTLEKLAPRLDVDGALPFGTADPDCDLREATRAGRVQLGLSSAFQAVAEFPVTRCYDGALVRYSDGRRDVTVVGTSDFMVNSGLLKEGNAALAMNLAGTAPRLIWYAPQRSEGETGGSATIFDLIPDQVVWIFWQLCLVVGLLAVWKARRLGPLVAEDLPVVVRASETVEGRGRLYRSRRAADRAADALRTAALQRMLPRLGLAHNASPPAVIQTVAARCGLPPQSVAYTLFGPPPTSDGDLVNLARELDDIERQVATS